MTRTVTLTLPVPPSVNQWTRALGRGRQVKTAAARQYVARVEGICRAYGLTPFREPVSVTLRWFRARRAGDLDNRVKICLDAICPWVVADDRYVVELHAYRYDGDLPGRVELEVRAA